jgi:hypothetical protein
MSAGKNILTDRPTAKDYGIDDASELYLSSSSYELNTEYVVSLFGWIGFVLAVVILVGKKKFDWVFWPIFFGFAVLGLVVGSAINFALFRLNEFWKRRHRLYGAWQNYLDASETWAAQHSAEIEAQRQREKLARQEREAKERQRREEQWRQLLWWKSLDGRTFECEVTHLLVRLGYDARLTPYSGDGGVDIAIQHAGRRIVVQCKAHASYIGPGDVRELYGTLIHEGADEAWLITTSGFSSGARSFAYGKPIKLLEIEELLNWGSTAGAPDATARQ